MEKLRDVLSMVLQNIQKEKEEEKVIVDIWCHFGHAYITDVDEGERKIIQLVGDEILYSERIRYFCFVTLVLAKMKV